MLSYRDPRFWEKFLERHWRPRVPTVLRQPIENFPFSEALLNRALHGFAEGLRGGDLRKHCLVSLGDREVAPRRPLRALFAERSHSIGELEARAARLFPKQRLGLVVTQMHATDPELWRALTAFLHDAAPWIDRPPRAFLDLFFGNYESDFTGLHKDTQEILAFVIRGEKRMLAWPFEYFLGKVKGLTPADRYFNKRLRIDHRKYRKDAIVLDARAGDVIYWPSDYWHVSEPRGKNFSAMVSLGLVRQEGGNKRAPTSGERAGTARELRWLSSFGFEIGGPLADTAAPVSSVVKIPTSVILWQSSGKRLLVATGGHSITLTQTPGLVRLLDRLTRGETITLAPSPPTSRTAVSETSWTKRNVPGTRRRTSRRSPEATLVDWLLRAYAVEPVSDYA